MRRIGLTVSLAVALLAAAASPASAALGLTEIAPNAFDLPIYATAPRSAADDLYVVERGGAIRVVHDDVLRAQPFLTIPGLSQAGEGGLLSMAFATDYATSGRFYVYVTPDGTGAPNAPIEVREYRRSDADPYVADPASARTVLRIPHNDATNHYGGTLQFGPDGYLYVGTGDGGGGGDPAGNAQNPDSLLGKLLRIDPRITGGAPYGIPAGNPYASQPGREPIWASGLRNPFRFSFDRANGDLLIGDVGQSNFEEVDRLTGPDAGRGLNFGWNRCEGTATYHPDGAPGSCGFAGLTAPIFTYGHAPGRCSITGGVVSRDPGVEELDGRYLYGDFCASEIHSQTSGQPADDAAVAFTPAMNTPSVAAFGEDACGRVYVVNIVGAGGVDAGVRRIGDGTPAASCATQPEFTPAASLVPAPFVQPGTQPPSGGTAAPPVSTARPPVGSVRLAVRATARQRALRRRFVAVRIRCSTACSLRVSARLSVRGRKPLSLRGVRRTGVTGTHTYRITLGRRARAIVRAALRAKRRATVTLTIEARGTANRTRATKRVRIIG